MSISGLVAEYIVAIDVTRVRFPADAIRYLYACCMCTRRGSTCDDHRQAEWRSGSVSYTHLTLPTILLV